MSIITYDFEVVAHDWLVVLKHKDTGEYTVIHNDNDAFVEFMNDHSEDVFFGFNSKHYDQYIAKAVAAGLSPQEVKQVNDYIIGGGLGWQCPLLQGIWYQFNNVDIRDDMQKGLSLKAIEGHLGMDIRESTVPFDIDRPLTGEELEEMIFYCKHDVDATEKIIDLRKDYLKNKIHIGKLAGISGTKALSMTNAKLTAALLKAERKEHDDEREYVYPDNLNVNYIPREVFDFFNRMYDKDISDDEFFKSKLELNIGDCEVVIGLGGLHGSIPNLRWKENANVETDT